MASYLLHLDIKYITHTLIGLLIHTLQFIIIYLSIISKDVPLAHEL